MEIYKNKQYIVTFLNFTKIILYSLASIIVISCSASQDKRVLKSNVVEEITQGSDGTKITPVYNHLTSVGYTLTIAENIGVKRQDTEMSLLCVNLNKNSDIAWDMSDFTGGKDFITPVDFMVVFSKDKEIFRHRTADNHIWNEDKIDKNSNPVILDIYPDRESIKYNFALTSKDYFTFSVNKIVSQTYFPPELTPTRLCMGLRRTDLLRWRGKVVPAQSIMIKHIQER